MIRSHFGHNLPTLIFMVDRKMIHSHEDWSKVPRTEFALKEMKQLFSTYDVHFILYYRPFIDWLPSMHRQFKKFTLLDRNYNFDEQYREPFEGRYGGIPSFPEYINNTINFMMTEQQQSTDKGRIDDNSKETRSH